MSLQIEALSPIMWTIIIAVALVLIAAVVFTWKSSAMSTRKMVTIAMLMHNTLTAARLQLT